MLFMLIMLWIKHLKLICSVFQPQDSPYFQTKFSNPIFLRVDRYHNSMRRNNKGEIPDHSLHKNELSHLFRNKLQKLLGKPFEAPHKTFLGIH